MVALLLALFLAAQCTTADETASTHQQATQQAADKASIPEQQQYINASSVIAEDLESESVVTADELDPDSVASDTAVTVAASATASHTCPNSEAYRKVKRGCSELQ